jgi:hypothetical protein
VRRRASERLVQGWSPVVRVDHIGQFGHVAQFGQVQQLAWLAEHHPGRLVAPWLGGLLEVVDGLTQSGGTV